VLLSQFAEMKKHLSNAAKKLPLIRSLVEQRDALIRAHGIAPPGHFYSPVISLEEVRRDEARIFRAAPRRLPGIDLNEERQLELLARFEDMYPSIDFPETKQGSHRYFYENPSYSYSDAIFLHCMMRYLQPRQYIEIGSGFSSCAALDTSQRFLDGQVAFTFIEPFPHYLQSIAGELEQNKLLLLQNRLQDVDPSIFLTLQANDVLFIDSTHVGKTGSDVNMLLFEILPQLAPGVYIHIHDIFYPFEYPKEWIFGGHSWNEIYMVRSFLEYNSNFSIQVFNTFLELFWPKRFQEKMPLCLKNPGGSIWLRKDA
jgi:hypothetical protein